MDENKKLDVPAQDEQKANTADPLDKPIGTKEPKKLEGKEVVVVGLALEEQFKKGEDKPFGKKAVFSCQHPDSKDLIKISTVKYFKTADKLDESGTWYNEDEDGNLAKLSALSKLMQHYKQENLRRFIGTKVNTIPGKDNYLAIKAY